MEVSDLTLNCLRLKMLLTLPSSEPGYQAETLCLYDYVNEALTYDWLVGCVGWNQWTSVDSQVLLESIYWLSWKCREVMDPFDLLLLRPTSISVANIDLFKQSNLIEGRPHFLMDKEWDEWYGSDFYPLNKEKSIYLLLLPERKVHFLHSNGSSGW